MRKSLINRYLDNLNYQDTNGQSRIAWIIEYLCFHTYERRSLNYRTILYYVWTITYETRLLNCFININLSLYSFSFAKRIIFKFSVDRCFHNWSSDNSDSSVLTLTEFYIGIIVLVNNKSTGVEYGKKNENLFSNNDPKFSINLCSNIFHWSFY